MANDGYQGAVDAFNNLRLANGEAARPYTANWQGIIDASTMDDPTEIPTKLPNKFINDQKGQI